MDGEQQLKKLEVLSSSLGSHQTVSLQALDLAPVALLDMDSKRQPHVLCALQVTSHVAQQVALLVMHIVKEHAHKQQDVHQLVRLGMGTIWVIAVSAQLVHGLQALQHVNLVSVLHVSVVTRQLVPVLNVLQAMSTLQEQAVLLV